MDHGKEMKKISHDKILGNFEAASSHYNHQAKLQSAIAWRLAKHCTRLEIPVGSWVDLGSGTGLLADALEKCCPKKDVLRLDGSPGMLQNNKPGSSTQLWDLNLGLPSFSEGPSLLASSFCLHWLSNPSKRLEEWFSRLAPGGWLAIAIPIDGSFPQWYFAAQAAGVHCTAMPLPSKNSLIQSIPIHSIRLQKLLRYTQKEPDVPSVLRPIRKVGAQASPNHSLGIKEWRKIYHSWPRSQNNEVAKLTWLVQMLLIQR